MALPSGQSRSSQRCRMVLSCGMPERSESVPSLVPLAIVGCPLTAAHHSSLPPNAPAVQMGTAGPERAPHSLRGTSHAHVYTQIQLQKMPKLTKQAFFPCNPHTAVRSAMDYAAAATPGAAQSGSGSSRLLGGLQDISASLTKHRSPSNVRLCQKETPPCRMQPRPLACAPSNRRLPSRCQRLPSSALQQSPGQVPQISSWHLVGSWMGRGGQLPLSSLQKSILMKEMAAGSAGWPRLPEGHGSVPGSGSPSCEMKAETILQEIK